MPLVILDLLLHHSCTDLFLNEKTFYQLRIIMNTATTTAAILSACYFPKSLELHYFTSGHISAKLYSGTSFKGPSRQGTLY